MSDGWHPRSDLATLVFDVGFEYSPEQDIIVSRHDAWQRHMGFTWAYDVACPAMQMIIDCEPVYFTYGSKNWMIELWKGQYGLETGGEIGVYNQAASAPPGPAASTFFDAIRAVLPGFDGLSERARESVAFYQCASDHEMLKMSFTLKRDGRTLFSRGPEKHWWLTGFKWGEFTRDTASLTMDAQITFPDSGMLDAFMAAFRALGYRHAQVTPGLTVAFTFGKPFTAQPPTRVPESAHQDANEALVQKYNQLKADLALASNDPNLINRSALSKEQQATYDLIAAFLNGMTTVQKVMPKLT